MKEIILIGGGGHCKSVIDVIEQEGKFQIIGIVDKLELLGTKVLSYPVIGSDSDLANLAKKYQYSLITVGQTKSPELRIKLFDLAIKSGFSIPTIISPRAYASKHAVLCSFRTLCPRKGVEARFLEIVWSIKMCTEGSPPVMMGLLG